MIEASSSLIIGHCRRCRITCWSRRITPEIEHYVRQADGSWNLRVYTGLEALIELTTLNCTLLPLAEVYDKIEWLARDNRSAK